MRKKITLAFVALLCISAILFLAYSVFMRDFDQMMIAVVYAVNVVVLSVSVSFVVSGCAPSLLVNKVNDNIIDGNYAYEINKEKNHATAT